MLLTPLFKQIYLNPDHGFHRRSADPDQQHRIRFTRRRTDRRRRSRIRQLDPDFFFRTVSRQIFEFSEKNRRPNRRFRRQRNSPDLLREKVDRPLPIAGRKRGFDSGLVRQGQPQGLGHGLPGQRDHLAAKNFSPNSLQRSGKISFPHLPKKQSNF